MLHFLYAIMHLIFYPHTACWVHSDSAELKDYNIQIDVGRFGLTTVLELL